MILKPLSTLEHESLGHESDFRRSGWEVFLGESLLIELYLASSQFHLIILIELTLT